jgi:hypothetical protein
MPLELDDLTRLVQRVAGEHEVRADIVGVTASEGDGCYAEVLVALPERHERVSIGLQRNADIPDLRRRIAKGLGVEDGDRQGQR